MSCAIFYGSFKFDAIFKQIGSGGRINSGEIKLSVII